MPPPHPRFRLVFSAFSVGLLANAVLPGRVGELARVAVLTRRIETNAARALWPTLVGTVFAHRVFDLVPVALLVVWVLVDREDPRTGRSRASGSCSRSASRCSCSRSRPRGTTAQTRLEGLGTVRRDRDDGAARPRRHAQARPAAASRSLGQCVGWTCQLFAVWTAMKAFDIDVGAAGGRARAGADERRDDHPALARQRRARAGRGRDAARVQYGVDVRARASPSGFGLQAIEASVGIGIGLIFLGREGLSFARLREMPGAVAADDAGDASRRRRRRPSVSPRALACPASLKGVPVRGGRRGRAGCGLRGGPGSLPTRCRSADGGEGTVDALCSRLRGGRGRSTRSAGRGWRARACSADGTRVVEAAEAIPLDPARLDVMAASLPRARAVDRAVHGLSRWS